MANYRIVAEIDPSRVTSGKDKVRQDLRQIDQAADQTKAKLRGAVADPALSTAITKLSSEIMALRGEMATLTQSNTNLSASTNAAVSATNNLAGAQTRGAQATRTAAGEATRGAASETQLEAAKMRVLQATDAEAAEMMRLNQIMAQATTLFNAGKITQEQYAAAQRLVAQGAAMEGASLGQRRAGYQQLGFQIQDITMQAALGINPLTILAQQAGQTASAVVLMTGKVTGFWAFMAGPWGSVIIAAVAILGMLATSFIGASSAADDHTSATQRNLSATEALGQAKSALGAMFDLTTGKVRDNTEATRLNTLALITNLRLQAQAQLLSSGATLAGGRTLPGMIDSAASTSGFVGAAGTAAQRGPAYESALTNQEILRRNGLTFNGRAATQEGRATALLALGSRELSLRDRAARETDRAMRRQLLASADSTHSLMEAVNNQVQGIRTQRLADDALRSAVTGDFDSQFKTAHSGGRGGGSHSDPVAEFFRRMEGARDVAGTPGGLPGLLADATRDFTNSTHHAPDASQAARIESLVRETEARGTLQRLLVQFQEPLEREQRLYRQIGLQREMNNAVMEEEDRLKRRLDPLEEAIIRNSIRERDATAQRQAVIESIDGPLELHSRRVAALNDLLRRGTISQTEFNQALAESPLMRSRSAVDAALGGDSAYQAQLRAITDQVDALINQVDQLEKAGIYSPDQASSARSRLRRQTGSDNNVMVDMGVRQTVEEQMKAQLERQRRAEVGQWDQELGGNFAYQAEVQRENDLNAERMETLRKFLEDGRLLREEYNARVEAEQDRHNQKLAEMDRARYQTAFHAASEGFGQLADAIKGFAGEHSRIYRGMLIVSKAFAIAEAVLGIQTAIAQAMKLGFPAAIPFIAQAIALGAGIIANIQAVTAQFKDGGYTGDGHPDEVKGVVHAGEFVVPAGPTRQNRALLEAMRNGASARDYSAATNDNRMNGGGRGALNVKINNYGNDNVEVRRGMTDDDIEVLITQKIQTESPRAVANDMAADNGRTGKVLKSTYGLGRDRK